MQKVLSAAARNPNLIPSDFMAYVVDYIQTSRLSIPIGQVFGFTRAQSMVGSVKADGTVGSGTGFTSVRNSLGNYTVTFDTPYASTPGVVALSETGNLSAQLISPSTSGFTITWWTSGAFFDSIFQFFAAEPS